MADLKLKAIKGDAAARAQLIHFLSQLTQEEGVAKNNFVARSDVRARMRSIRGRIENALPAVEREAAKAERERIVHGLRLAATRGLEPGRASVVLAAADDIEMGLLP